METDLTVWVKRYLRQSEEELRRIYRYQEALNLQRYFRTLRYAPGLEEHAALLALMDTVERHGEKDLLVFDTPPTALTLKFLALPQVSLIWLEELRRLRSTILEKKDIITRVQTGRDGRLRETDPVLLKLEAMVERYGSFAKVLQDTDRTQVFLVLNPDKLSLAESRMIHRELGELGIGVPYVLLNKWVAEDEPPYFLHRHFSGSRLLWLERQSSDSVTGIATLRALGFPLDLAEAGLAPHR
jgi:arsenite-transporting ATPase